MYVSVQNVISANVFFCPGAIANTSSFLLELWFIITVTGKPQEYYLEDLT